RRFDKQGEQFYDQISALHKSVRSSDPDAAVYWLARMLDGGCDPSYLARRMTRMAVEAVGLAEPRAWRMALDAWDTYERLGSPEGELGLAQLAIWLAVAPKSNAAYMAWATARATSTTTTPRAASRWTSNACPTRWMAPCSTSRWNAGWSCSCATSCWRCAKPAARRAASSRRLLRAPLPPPRSLT